MTQIHPAAIDEFKNAYNLEFLSLSDGHSEADLHAAPLHNLGRFIRHSRADSLEFPSKQRGAPPQPRGHK